MILTGIAIMFQDSYANQTLACRWEVYRDENKPTSRPWGPGQPMIVEVSKRTLRINNNTYDYFKEDIGPNGLVRVHYRRKDEMASLGTASNGKQTLSLLNTITNQNYAGTCQ